MAFADYRLCDVCGGKAFYDAGLNYESAGENDPESYAVAGARAKWGSKLDSLGDWAVICRSCAEQHRTCLIGPCVSVDPEAPAEHLDASLRERLGELADALFERARREPDPSISAGLCIADRELRALLQADPPKHNDESEGE